MHQFFAIIKNPGVSPSSDAHLSFWKKLKNKFPKQYAGGLFHSGAVIDIWGHYQKATFADTHELYFIGEIYNENDIWSNNNSSDSNAVASNLLNFILQKGWDGLAKLNGRFTILFLDHSLKTLVFRNDQMGVQQLFLHRQSDFLLLGSELKFFLNHPRCPANIDWIQALKRPIPFIVLDGEQNYNAWFKGIHLLEEGHQVDYSLTSHKLTNVSYWNAAKTEPSYKWKNSSEIMEEYISLLEDAVKIRIHDQPEAYSFLSGGLDSSIICALAKNHSRLNTFSIVSQTTLLEGTSDFCDRLARDLHFQNSQFLIPYNNLIYNVGLWKKRIWRAESPFAHTDSLTKTLLHYCLQKYQNNIPYVLTGTGSDQLNGGLTRWIVTDPEMENEKWKTLSQAIYQEELKSLIPQKWPVLWNCRNFLTREFINESASQQLNQIPFHFYIKSNLHINLFTLHWDENRAASHYRRSVRYPFLDHRFLPFMYSIPPEFHGELFYDKEILRNPSHKHLPHYILDKPKGPAMTGSHDKRASMYTYLLSHNNYALIHEALENNRHIVNIPAILLELEALKINPHPIRFEYLMHLINLGLLEKLGDQDEISLDFESELDPLIENMSPWSEEKSKSCRKKLKISSEDEILNQTLAFYPNCSLVQDAFNQKHYLVKDEVLIYEIDNDQTSWLTFLESINNHRSVSEILQLKEISIEEVRDHFNTCIKERIIQTLDPRHEN